MKFHYDNSGELEKYVSKVTKEYFPLLECIKFLYVWREDPSYDDEDQLIIASVRKLSNRDRDIFGYDIIIEVDHENWPDLLPSDKFKIVYHELLHIKIEMDSELDDEELKNAEAITDKDGRIKIHIETHDIVIKRFEKELTIFGLSKDEKKIRQLLNDIHKKEKSGEIKPLKVDIMSKDKKDKSKKKVDKGKKKIKKNKDDLPF